MKTEKWIRLILRNDWLALQDVIGDAKTWPIFVRETFWNPHFNDHNRMIVVNFAIVNGVGEEFLHDVLTFTLGRGVYTRDRRSRVAARYAYYNDVIAGRERRSRAYSYDLYHRKLLTLDGEFYRKARHGED